MNIFKEMGLSIFSFKTYQEFLKNKKSKVFGFGVVLMLIYFLLTMVAPFVSDMVVNGSLEEQIDDLLPDFELEDGYLWIDDVIEYDDGDIYVYIDTDPEYFFYSADEMKEYLYDYSQAILMDSEKIIIKDSGTVQELYYSDIGEDFSKDDLLGIIPYLYAAIVICMVLAYIFMTAFFFFGVLFVALMGMIAASCMKCDLTFGQLYLLGVYSRTLPLIIKAVLSLLSINLNIFINFGISLAIVICAIRKMKKEQVQQPLEFNSGNNGENNYGGNFSGNYENKETMNLNGVEQDNKGNDFSWMQ